MTADRAEWTGVGAAFVFHVLLIAALSTSLASMERTPEPPSMEVELVDEVALQSAAPTPVAQPARAEPPPIAQQLPQPQAQPEPIATPPPPQPRVVIQPTARPAPQPPRPRVQPQPSSRTENQPRQRPGLGDDFLKSFDDDLAPSNARARPAAPAYNAQARASISSSIAAQAQRCADREPYIGEGADRLRLTVNLLFARSGRLARPPRVVRVAGDSDLRAKYGELLEDQVRRIFTDCAPFRLPTELYDTPEGGWKETILAYRVQK